MVTVSKLCRKNQPGRQELAKHLSLQLSVKIIPEQHKQKQQEVSDGDKEEKGILCDSFPMWNDKQNKLTHFYTMAYRLVSSSCEIHSSKWFACKNSRPKLAPTISNGACANTS